MNWQTPPYVLVLLITAVISIAIAVLAWNRRPAAGARTLVWLMAFTGWWSLCYALELASFDLPSKLFWVKAEYLGIVNIPVAWMLLVFRFTGRHKVVNRRNILTLLLLPAVTMVLAWTNDWHHLVYRNHYLDFDHVFPVLIPVYGAWFWIFIAYAYLVMLAGVFLLVQSYLGAAGLYRKQAGVLIVGAAVPWLANLLYLAGLNPFPFLDLTPFAFAGTGLASAWALLSYQWMNFVPVARDVLLENLDNAVIVLDQQNRVLDLNLAAGQLVGVSSAESIGRDASQVLAGWAELQELFGGDPNVRREIELEQGGIRHFFDLDISALNDKRGDVTGRLIVLHDITERKRAEEEIHLRTAELEAVRQLGLEITAQLDLDALLHSIASWAIQLLDGASGGLYLYRPERELLEWVVAIGPDLAPVGSTLELGEGLSGKVWETGEALLINDYDDWDGKAPVYREFTFSAVLGVPIRWGDEFLGVLDVLRNAPQTFGTADLELMSLFATQAAIAIKNAQLVQQQREQWELAESLAQAAAIVNSTHDFDDVLDRILEQVERVVPGDTFNVMLVEGDQVRIARARGYRRVGLIDPIPEKPFPMSRYPNLVKMMQTGQSISIEDTGAEKEWVAAKQREWRRSYLGAPILVGGVAVGFLNVNGTRVGQFGSADEQRLSAFANHAATAFENARLVAGLEDQVADRTADIQLEKERTEAILRSVGDAIVVSDLEWRIEYVNNAFLDLTGYSEQEILGKRAGTVGAVIQSDQIRQVMFTTLNQGKLWQGEAIGRRKDGRRYDAALTIAPVLDTEGQFVGYVSSHRDISQQKGFDRARNRFLTNVSHELRTPLTNITLYTHLLNSNPDLPKKTKQYLGVLNEQAERLKALVQDILQMTSLDSGHALETWERVQLSTLVQDVAEKYEGRVQAAGLTLQLEPIPNNLPLVMGDGKRLSQAVSELIENAIAFTGEGGRITLEIDTALEPEQVWVTLAIKDTGVGISPEEQGFIFDRFYRGSPTESGNIPGIGLGLSIVQAIMRAHGGRVTVESELGQGSTFALWLRSQDAGGK